MRKTNPIRPAAGAVISSRNSERRITKRNVAKRLARLAAMLAIGLALPSQAMAVEILDGTTGSNVSSSAKSTTGRLTLGLGFFVD